MRVYLHNFELGATDADAETLTNDLAGVSNVVEHGLVHGSEGLGPLTVHLEGVVGVGLGADLTLGDESNDAAVELLLELLGELGLDPV